MSFSEQIRKVVGRRAEKKATREANYGELVIDGADEKNRSTDEIDRILEETGHTPDQLQAAIDQLKRRREDLKILAGIGDPQAELEEWDRQEAVVKQQMAADQQKHRAALSTIAVNRTESIRKQAIKADVEARLRDSASPAQKAAAAAVAAKLTAMNRQRQRLVEELGLTGGKDVRLVGPNGQPAWGDSVVYRLAKYRREVRELTAERDELRKKNRSTDDKDQELRKKQDYLATLEKEEKGYREALEAVNAEIERIHAEGAYDAELFA